MTKRRMMRAERDNAIAWKQKVIANLFDQRYAEFKCHVVWRVVFQRIP